ncbi:MAG: PQQ-binding-like beta-propeller repeat protein [Hyphomicrobiaceae bacterium]|nr:PQQ-binding-like beta-propeller repeat protein [Hyphomicrobiaceae bacterium]
MRPTRRDIVRGGLCAAGASLAGAPPAALAAGGVAELPAWRYGSGSFASDTVLMFRGNPAHTFYGTGPVPDSPRLAWRFQTARIDNVVRGTPMTWTGTGWTGTAIKLGDYVFVGSVGGYVYCLEAATGRLVWQLKGAGMFKGSPCAYENRIYIGNTDNLLRSIDAATGRLLWSHDTGKDLDSSPCVVDGRLYIAGENGYARCLDPRSGKLLWKSFLGGIEPGTVPGSNGVESSPAVVDGDFFAVDYHGRLYCLDIRDGRIKWTAETGDDTDASVVVAGDLIYAAAEENSSFVFAFERESGKEVWRYGGNPKGYWSTPAVVGDRLYVGGDDANLHCLDARSGKVIWTHATGDAIWSSPCVVDGKVVFGSRDAHLYVLDAKSGALISRTAVDGRIISSPCIVDGAIYIGTATGYVYGFLP